jgi:hypothetical protein
MSPVSVIYHYNLQLHLDTIQPDSEAIHSHAAIAKNSGVNIFRFSVILQVLYRNTPLNSYFKTEKLICVPYINLHNILAKCFSN